MADTPPGSAAPSRRVFRSSSSTIALVGSGAVAIVLLGDALLRAGILEMLSLVPWVLLVLWIIYVAVFASHISIGADGALVQNYLRRTMVPWQRVAHIHMRWQVVFDLDDDTQVKAYGGPVAGRPGRPGVRDSPRVPPALRELSLIREEWESAGQRNAPDAAVTRSWDVPALLALGVIIVAAISAVLSAHG